MIRISYDRPILLPRCLQIRGYAGLTLMCRLLIGLALSTSLLPADTKAAWTVMVYMNAKNNLEADGIQNFLEMASLPNSKDVNILVEMGRPKNHVTTDYGGWSGVRIFRVTNKLTPTSEHAALDLSSQHMDDMGSTQPLEKLLLWGKEHYPANHYMLIIWNHGQGWRFQLSKDPRIRIASTSRAESLIHEIPASKLPPSPGYFKSVSFDDDTNHFFYNRDIQRTLTQLKPQIQLNVVGFDACLMSMIETAYAMRGVAETMVGSEELEPGAGWSYKDWLPQIAKNPTASPIEVAKMAVTAYRDRYGDTYKTTQSAIDLAAVSTFSRQLSEFSQLVRTRLGVEIANLRAARAGCKNYGEDAGLHNSIDLALFLDRYAAATKDQQIRQKARAVQSAIKANLVVGNYASERVQGDFGSNGIAIYFPLNKQRFVEDAPDNKGYDPTIHDSHAVEFVEKETWPLLLQEYLNHP